MVRVDAVTGVGLANKLSVSEYRESNLLPILDDERFSDAFIREIITPLNKTCLATANYFASGRYLKIDPEGIL